MRVVPTSIFTACILLGTLRAQASEAFRDHVYYFGDLHAHTGYSEIGRAHV